MTWPQVCSQSVIRSFRHTDLGEAAVCAGVCVCVFERASLESSAALLAVPSGQRSEAEGGSAGAWARPGAAGESDGRSP
jgi:hypothetical protein